MRHTPEPHAEAPVGVFDSGIGGLSVLRALVAELPYERFVYLADNAHAPYGERDDAFVTERARAVLARLTDEHAIKALVIACNTATAAAVQPLRAAHAHLPIIGIEPALKPAAALSRTGHVGVLATRGTLRSEKFQALLRSLEGQARFRLQACDGLADAIENEAASASHTMTGALIDRHLSALGNLGRCAGEIDTLVLGCTHYPLVLPVWQARLAGAATLLDPAEAVARQTQRVLAGRGLLRHAPAAGESPSQPLWLTTGTPRTLATAAARWQPAAPATA